MLVSLGRLSLFERTMRSEVFFLSGFVLVLLLQVIVCFDWAVPGSINVALELLRSQGSNLYVQVVLASVFFLINSVVGSRVFSFLFCFLVFFVYGFQFLLLKNTGEFFLLGGFEFDWKSFSSLFSSVRADFGFAEWSVLLLVFGCIVANCSSLQRLISLCLNTWIPFRWRAGFYAVILVCAFSSDLLREFFRENRREYICQISTSPFVALAARRDSNFGDEIPSQKEFERESALTEKKRGKPLLGALCERCDQNLILIVLESVGSKNVLTSEGRIDKEKMPFLADRSKDSVIFSSVSSPFPGTTRSHIALQTGGLFPVRTVWASGKVRYAGTTLARTLKGAGFSTALISAQALSFENLLGFYRGIGFDEIFTPDLMSNRIARQNRTSSWGINDEVAANATLEWWHKNSGKRRFVQFLTHSTHHPYVSRHPRIESLSSSERYYYSQRFVDSTVEKMLSGLDSLENTLVVVMGDHGEAFSDLHPGNRLHRSALYEENIRSFLAVVRPIGSGFRSVAEPFSMGSVAPTLVEALGLDARDFPESSFREGNEGSPIFSYKMAYPMKCSVRIGPMKSIFSLESDGRCEVYRVKDDDDETMNLLGDHGQLCAREKCKEWLQMTHREFLKRVQGSN